MRKYRLFPVVVGLALIVSPALARAGGVEWIQDFNKAKALAQKDNKDLLMDFTGSDWCIWCKRLHGEVFATELFKSKIGQDFVLVKLDFPRDKSLVTPEIQAQNAGLQQEFGIEGYPTVFLADAEGRPYAKTGYQQGGPAKYLDHLSGLRSAHQNRDRFLAQAEEAEGTERARLLDKALSSLDSAFLLPFYVSLVDEIIELDADGTAGLKERYEGVLQEHEAKAIVQEIEKAVQGHAQKGEWAELQTTLDGFAKDHADMKPVVQQAYFYKGIAFLQTNKADQGIEWIKKAKAVDPTSDKGKQMDMIIAQITKQMEAKKKAGGDTGKATGGDGGF